MRVHDGALFGNENAARPLRSMIELNIVVCMDLQPEYRP